MIRYALISLGALALAYFLGIFTGAHYVPTSEEKALRMLALADLRPGERFVDIGSGDGRLVVAASERGAQAFGFELNPLLVFWSRRRIRHAGARAAILWADFWRRDFSDFDVVAVYGIPHIMRLLERKLRRELKPGARVVSNAFPFPSWPGKEERGAYLYVKE